ncbi:uncharacterized protein LOC111263541 isoform X2 [Varroa jacobsoni]|uniref:uncharacterized protein LOC111263541 isoform X2 n=1 Tax=Varroa jacobsoni TaxID=62625 RepID=UPI000BF28904|nr:uncharacterized protein LOC111263541 isoform X2 [Varroa jacobsoni]
MVGRCEHRQFRSARMCPFNRSTLCLILSGSQRRLPFKEFNWKWSGSGGVSGNARRSYYVGSHHGNAGQKSTRKFNDFDLFCRKPGTQRWKRPIPWYICLFCKRSGAFYKHLPDATLKIEVRMLTSARFVLGTVGA